MIEQVPQSVDTSYQAAWWKPVVRRSSGWVYVALNVPAPTEGQHHVRVGKRSPGGTWTWGYLLDDLGAPAVFDDDIGHRQPTIALDGAGLIHVWAGMHTDPWRYWRSNAAGDVATLHPHHTDMPDQAGAYTYPVAATAPNGDVYVMVRQAVGSDRYGQLYRWDGTTWAHELLFADAEGFAPYPDDLYVDDIGVHILWEWSAGISDPLRHCVSYALWDGINLATADGAVDDVADAPDGLYAIHGLAAGESLQGEGSAPGVQSAKFAIVDGDVFVAYRRRFDEDGPFQVLLAQHESGGWRPERTVYAGQYDTHAALAVEVEDGIPTVSYCKKLTSGVGRAHEARLTWVEEPVLASSDVQRLASTDGATLYVAPTAQTVWLDREA